MTSIVIMSTIGTNLNWGASYLVNDFYRRFLRPGRDERHYVRASRWASLLVALLAAYLQGLLAEQATPRRLAAVVHNLAARQADREEPVWGPALKAAKDAAGAWTPAG